MQSSFQKLLSYSRVEWRENFACIEMPVEARHLNLGNAVHGGVVATLLDDTMGYAGIYSPAEDMTNNAITISITVSFLRPAKTSTVSCSAMWQGGGRNIFVSRGEVHTAEGELVAIGEGTYRIVPSEKI